MRDRARDRSARLRAGLAGGSDVAVAAWAGGVGLGELVQDVSVRDPWTPAEWPPSATRSGLVHDRRPASFTSFASRNTHVHGYLAIFAFPIVHAPWKAREDALDRSGRCLQALCPYAPGN